MFSRSFPTTLREAIQQPRAVDENISLIIGIDLCPYSLSVRLAGKVTMMKYCVYQRFYTVESGQTSREFSANQYVVSIG